MSQVRILPGALTRRRYVAAMSSELIAWVVAITLGVAVVVLGWRRELGDTTREWLPRFEGSSKPEAATLMPANRERGRRPLSPGERRAIAGLNLMLSLLNGVTAVTRADDWLLHAIIAVLFALSAVAVLTKKLPLSKKGLTS